MKYNKLGNRIAVSEIGFGCIPILSGSLDIMPRHFNSSYQDSKYILDKAYEFGINFFDTAIKEEYGDTENKLFYTFKEKREKIIISSKARKFEYADMKEAILSSLRELNTDYIDIYGIHQITPFNFDKSMNFEMGAIRALIEAKQEGKIRMISVGTHFASTAANCSKFEEIEMIQIPCNPLEFGLLDTAISEGLDKNKLVFHKIYGGGLLPSLVSVRDLISYALSLNPISALVGVGTMIEMNHLIEGYNGKESFQDEILIPYSECNRCQRCSCGNGVNIPLILRFRAYALNGFHRWAMSGFEENYLSPCNLCNDCLQQCPRGINIPFLIKETEDFFNQLTKYNETLQ